MLADLFTKTGAVFSPCNTYRYRLWRIWDDTRPPLVMLMLNPSIANVEINDPTVERCQRRAVAGGFGGLQVVNIFALVSTDPARLYAHADPVGPDNDAAILDAIKDGGMLIAAWGTHGQHVGRALFVMEMLRKAGVTPYCLGTNADGSPKHPLYMKNSIEPQPYNLNCVGL